MALMRTSNPALNAKTFADVRRDPSAPAMTLEGTVNKAAFLLFLVAVPAAWVWSQVRTGFDPAVAGPWIALGVIGGLIAAIVTIVKKAWSPVTAPVYAALEGLALGGLSALLETKYPGIVMQAVGLTFATLAAMLLAYRSGLIKATEKFKLGVVAATGAIALDRKSTRLNSSHQIISYAVFCLKKKIRLQVLSQHHRPHDGRGVFHEEVF